MIDEDEALREWGHRLTVASLGLISKGVDEEGVEDFRILHDGTFGVAVNNRIKQLDHTGTPTCFDLKRCLAEMAADGRPAFGATADGKDAHSVVPVDRRDWGYQANRPGGPRSKQLALKTVGTYGISSAGYF